MTMKTNKTAAVLIAAVLFFQATGCATAGGKRLKTSEFQNAVGAACVLAGMGAGAYEGASLAGGNSNSFYFGFAGGLLGAAAAGAAYWLILNLTGEKIDEDSLGNTLPAEDKLLLPKE